METRTPEIYTYCHHLSLHDALPILRHTDRRSGRSGKPQKPSLASGGSAPTPLKRRIGICNKSRSPPFCVPDMISNWQGASSEPDQGRPLEKKRSEEHTSDLQSLMRISYAVFCLKKKTTTTVL